MPVDVRSVSSRAGEDAAGDTGDTNLVVDAPAGVADGDLLVAFAERSGTATSVTEFTASGWAEAGFIPSPGDHAVIGVLTRPAGASEPATYTFNVDAFDGTDQFIVHILCLTGADTTDPLAVVPEFLDAPSTSSQARAPSIDIPAGLPDDALLITHHTLFNYEAPGDPQPQWIGLPAGMTLAADASGVWLRSLTVTELVGAGATGDRDATFEQTSEGPPRCLSLAIRPASTGPPPVDIFVNDARSVARATRPLIERVPELIVRSARAVARASRPLLFRGMSVRPARSVSRASRPLIEQQLPDLVVNSARAAVRASRPLIELPPGSAVCNPTTVEVVPAVGTVGVNTGGTVRVEPGHGTVELTCEET